MELIIKIAAVDKEYKKDEEELINSIANNLEIKMDTFRKLTDKHVAVKFYEDLNNVNDLLGLKDDMSDEEKKAHLRKEYRKWNQRVANSDPKVREQAGEMLKIIAEERSKLRK